LVCGARDMSEFGALLHESWQMKRALSASVSTNYVDEAYEAARSAGAYGGKLLGAGGGGFLMIFADPSRHERIREKLGRLLHVPVEFERQGTQIIYHDPSQ
jgi:D-glycero-alpha-D-manno-heptose-7-phosphate kinase